MFKDSKIIINNNIDKCVGKVIRSGHSQAPIAGPYSFTDGFKYVRVFFLKRDYRLRTKDNADLLRKYLGIIALMIIKRPQNDLDVFTEILHFGALIHM